MAPTIPHTKTTVVDVVVVAVELTITLVTLDLTELTQQVEVAVEALTAKQTYLVEQVPQILALVEAVVLTTAQITMVVLVVQELWSSDTKSELCLNDKLLHGGL